MQSVAISRSKQMRQIFNAKTKRGWWQWFEKIEMWLMIRNDGMVEIEIGIRQKFSKNQKFQGSIRLEKLRWVTYDWHTIKRISSR